MSKVSYIILSCFFSIVIPAFSQEYTVSPTVPDFTDIRADWVVATYGTRENPFQSVGIADGRHTVITEQGRDPNIRAELWMLPENVGRVVRLGNAEGKSGAESLTYYFIVDPERPLLQVKFAAVFNDQLHWLQGEYEPGRPHFMVQVLDKEGDTDGFCHSRDLYINSSFEPSFVYQDSPGGRLRPMAPGWTNWPTLILDMTAYAGKEVQVRFVTYDGNRWFGNYGYVYYVASCVSNKMQISDCEDKSFTLSVPEVFDSYEWFNGFKTPAMDWKMGVSDMRLSCVAKTRYSCPYTYTAYVTDHRELPEKDSVIYDTIYQGDKYEKNDFQISAYPRPGQFVYYRTFYDTRICGRKGTTSLFLTVKQRYYPVEGAICYGEDYIENGFEIHRPSPGIWLDTLSFITAAGDDSVVTLRLSVATDFSMPDGLQGNPSPCIGTQETYRVLGTQYSEGYWEVPDGAEITERMGTGQIKVNFLEEVTNKPIVFHGSNGCGEGDVQLKVSTRPSYWQRIMDTVCLGDEYHEHGFHIPRKEESGLDIFYGFYTTDAGCDSVRSLVLWTASNPEVEVIASDTLVCSGEQIRLDAVPVHGEESVPTDFVRVGDIWCEDGTFVRREAYATSGKTAQGIVFWVDDSGKHGWAVSLQNQCDACAWVTDESIEIPEVNVYPEVNSAVEDTAGYQNTKLLRERGHITDYPVLECIPFEEGWYVPAVKQLYFLYSEIKEVNKSLETTGNLPLPTEETLDRYSSHDFWSSTQCYVSGEIGFCDFYMENRGSTGMTMGILVDTKDWRFSVRAIRNF